MLDFSPLFASNSNLQKSSEMEGSLLPRLRGLDSPVLVGLLQAPGPPRRLMGT